MTGSWINNAAQELRAELAARGSYLPPAAAEDHILLQRTRMSGMLRISETDAQSLITTAFIRQWAADLAAENAAPGKSPPAQRARS